MVRFIILILENGVWEVMSEVRSVSSARLHRGCAVRAGFSVMIQDVKGREVSL